MSKPPLERKPTRAARAFLEVEGLAAALKWADAAQVPANLREYEKLSERANALIAAWRYCHDAQGQPHPGTSGLRTRIHHAAQQVGATLKSSTSAEEAPDLRPVLLGKIKPPP